MHNVTQAEQEVGTTSKLYFYDWEANVLTPNGKTAASQLLGPGSDGAGAQSGRRRGRAGHRGREQHVAVCRGQARRQAAAGGGVPCATQDVVAARAPAVFAFGAPGSSACATVARAQKTTPVQGQYCYLAGGQGISSVSELRSSMPDGIPLSQATVLTVPRARSCSRPPTRRPARRSRSAAPARSTSC